MTKKKKKELLRAQMLCALIIGSNAMLGGTAANAQYFAAGDYNNDITLTETLQVDNVGTVNINGNLKVATPAWSYALYAYGTDGITGILRVNMNKNKTVQIDGNLRTDGNAGDIYVNFSNPDSYLAGKNERGNLSFSNGATWYVPDDTSSVGTITATGGNLDFWHATPTTTRGSAAGARTGTLNNVGSNLNGANFIISSDIQNNTADQVVLNNVSGSNTYTVQVAYDPAMSVNDTYTAANAPTILTTSNTGNTVTAKAYRTTRIEDAGLKTVNIQLTPTLSTTGNETKLTALTVEKAPDTDGPAAIMAGAASAVQLAALGAWRAENNDLQRRLGDLRWDEGSAGAWARAYGGESQIHSGAGTDVSYHGIQVGYDRARAFGEGKLFTGFALSNMKGDASGSSDLDSKLFGVYGSYLGKRGHFIDAIIKYGRFTNNTTRTYGGVNYAGDYGTNGLNMSLEYGYHKQLHNGFYLEPQAELNYSHLNSTSYTMSAGGTSGAFVQNNGMDSLIARVGINAGRKTKDGNLYLKLSCLHEFSGDTGMTASYSGTTVSSSSSGSDTWLEYGIGFNQRIASNQNLYGEITRTAWADKVSDNWKANLGWRVSF